MPLSDEELAELASAPRRTTTDEGTVQEHDLDQLAKAQEIMVKQSQPNKVPWGMRVARTVPRGTV